MPGIEAFVRGAKAHVALNALAEHAVIFCPPEIPFYALKAVVRR